MLEENSKESLHAAKQGAVNHERPVLSAIFPDVGQVEALRKIEVELDRAELPGPADRIVDQQVDFGAVKCAITGIDLILDAGSLQCILEGFFRSIPVFFAPDSFWRPCAEIQLELVEAERSKN